MDEFAAVIESTVSIPHLKNAILEAYFASFNSKSDGNINNVRQNVRNGFRTDDAGTMSPEEMEARIEQYRKNSERLGIPFDEEAYRRDMVNHPSKYRKPMPRTPMKTMNDMGNVVQEMSLPTMSSIRERCYTETLDTISKFLRSCRILDFDYTGNLNKILLADQAAESRHKAPQFDRTKPFPDLSSIENVFGSWLVRRLTKDNLPFKGCIGKAFAVYKKLQELEAKGPEDVDSWKCWNYISTAPGPENQ